LLETLAMVQLVPGKTGKGSSVDGTLEL
jgi:hypothetical protein